MGVEQKGKTPLLIADIQKILGRLPDNVRGTRDAALFLVGFARRLSPLGARRLTFVWPSAPKDWSLASGAPRQIRKGREERSPFLLDRIATPVPSAPYKSGWMRAQISFGPLFRQVSSHGYAVEEFASHNLRAGFATQAAANGAQRACSSCGKPATGP